MSRRSPQAVARDRRFLARVVALRDGYAAGEVDIGQLQGEVEATANALAGDTHLTLRAALSPLASELELARFTMDGAEQRAHVLCLLDAAVASMRQAFGTEAEGDG
jgi:hypothetical protein